MLSFVWIFTYMSILHVHSVWPASLSFSYRGNRMKSQILCFVLHVVRPYLQIFRKPRLLILIVQLSPCSHTSGLHSGLSSLVHVNHHFLFYWCPLVHSPSSFTHTPSYQWSNVFYSCLSGLQREFRDSPLSRLRPSCLKIFLSSAVFSERPLDRINVERSGDETAKQTSRGHQKVLLYLGFLCWKSFWSHLEFINLFLMFWIKKDDISYSCCALGRLHVFSADVNSVEARRLQGIY